jgi:hypothetical protein
LVGLSKPAGHEAYNAAHPEEYRRVHDSTYEERKRLVDDITLAIHHWRDQGNPIPYKKGPRDPGDFEIVDGINQMTQTRSDLETLCEVLYDGKRSLDQLRTLKAVLPSAQWEADYSARAPVPVSTPSPLPQPKIHTTSPETYFVERGH